MICTSESVCLCVPTEINRSIKLNSIAATWRLLYVMRSGRRVVPCMMMGWTVQHYRSIESVDRCRWVCKFFRHKIYMRCWSVVWVRYEEMACAWYKCEFQEIQNLYLYILMKTAKRKRDVRHVFRGWEVWSLETDDQVSPAVRSCIVCEHNEMCRSMCSSHVALSLSCLHLQTHSIALCDTIVWRWWFTSCAVKMFTIFPSADSQFFLKFV